jgi:two-component system nitrate/nitrite response regulator NarL
MRNGPSLTRILIADDPAIFRQGLRALLEGDPDFRVVGEAGDGAEAIRLIPQLLPDVLLPDLAMPLLPDMEGLRKLGVSSMPRPDSIVLTVGIDKEEILEALELGARGIVLKDHATRVLATAIRTVIAGGCWVGREAVADLARYLQDQATGKGRAATTGSNTAQRPVPFQLLAVRGEAPILASAGLRA